MKATNPHHILAASYRRLAKTLRIRATAYNRAAKECHKVKDKDGVDYWIFRATAARELADEFDNEARILKGLMQAASTIRK